MSDDSSFFDELSSSALQSGAPVLDVVAALLASEGRGERLRVLEIGAHMATLVSGSGKAVRVFRVPEEKGSLRELIEQLVAHNPRAGSEAVLVGGGPHDSEVIAAAVPTMLMHPFVAFHRSSSGEVRSFPKGKGHKSPRWKALQSVRVLAESERRELLLQIQGHAQTLQHENKERAQFFRGMNTRPPVVTYGLLVMIGLMFALQNLLAPQSTDGFDQGVFMISMGALFPPLVAEGEWYRMISAGFLHGGVMHVGVNGFVLYLLGGQTERVLGSVRFILLYTVALLAGSYASAQFLGNGMSVGASGAVWGLLGAQVALAYGRPPVLPKSVAESMKPLAKQNILLNVGISFLPGIDAAAHFGGGLAGAALLASGILYSKSKHVAEGGNPAGGRPVPGLPVALPFAAALSALLLLWGVASALIEGEPWNAEAHARELREQVN